jgi:hypothetical protein
MSPWEDTGLNSWDDNRLPSSPEIPSVLQSPNDNYELHTSRQVVRVSRQMNLYHHPILSPPILTIPAIKHVGSSSNASYQLNVNTGQFNYTLTATDCCCFIMCCMFRSVRPIVMLYIDTNNINEKYLCFFLKVWHPPSCSQNTQQKNIFPEYK